MGKGSGNCLERGAIALMEAPATSAPIPHRPKNYNSAKLNFEYITDEAGIQEVKAALAHSDVHAIGLDIETTGSGNPWGGSIRLIQLAVEEPEPRQFVIDTWHCDASPTFSFLQDPQKEIVICNAAFEQKHFLYRYGVELSNIYDVMHAGMAIKKSLQPKAVKGQKTKRVQLGANFRLMMRRYPGKKIDKTQQTSGWNQEHLSNAQLRYAALDAAGLLDISRGIKEDVTKRGLETEVARANSEIVSKSYRTIEVHAGERQDQAERLIRAFNHSEGVEELDRFRSLMSRIPLPHTQLDRVNRAYAERWAKLSVASDLEAAA